MSTKSLFAIMALFATCSVVSFFQINSAWADAHHFNGLFGWLGIGIVLGFIAIWLLIKIAKRG